jgi:outer membrane protein TolC
VTLNQFRASRIASRANVLTREGALRNILGLPASDGKTIVPVSMPASLRYKPEWNELIRFAEQMRPDLIELKLVLEADGQRKIQAENSTLPQLDATATYRWNGLSGRLPPFGEKISSDLTQFPDWTVGITFSVPLGLREGRARVREQDLIILPDKANLEQGLHAASGDLAVTVRDSATGEERWHRDLGGG